MAAVRGAGLHRPHRPAQVLLLYWGLVACVLLAVVLTFSPLRVLWPGAAVPLALNRHRRLVGVAACAYALLHLAAHTRHVYDGSFDTFLSELGKPFQLKGLVALVLANLGTTIAEFAGIAAGAELLGEGHRDRTADRVEDHDVARVG